MDGKIKIELEKREDSWGKTFYVGKIKSPITIDCEKGVAFLVFASSEGEEELQICNLENPKSKKMKTPKVYKQPVKRVK